MKKNKLGQFGHSFKLLFRGMGVILKVEPWLIPITILSAILNSLYPFIGIYFSAQLLNELVSETCSREKLITYAILTVVLSFASKIITQFLGQMADILQYVLMHKKELFIAEKCCKLDYSDMEDAKVKEERERLMHYRYERGIMSIQEQIRKILQSVLSIGVSASVMISLFFSKGTEDTPFAVFIDSFAAKLIIFFIWICTVVYASIKMKRIQQLQYQRDIDTKTVSNHFYFYAINGCLNYQCGMDIRLYKQRNIFIDKITYFQEIIRKSNAIVIGKSGWYEALRVVLGELFSAVVYLYVAAKALCGAFPVGDVLMYAGVIHQFAGGFEELTLGVNSVLINAQYLEDYFVFLDRKNAKMTGTRKITSQIKSNYIIEFKDVSFSYPGATTCSLQHVSCVLKSGEKLAIVGRNGSGKTTFIKLLSRLYDPQEGEILLNGVNIKEYDYADYLAFFSVVFQDYVMLSLPIGQNVAANVEYDEDKAKECLENAGFGKRLASLMDGMKTLLFKYYSNDGIEVSGGEEQKIAIARALYKDAPFVILDEPTAALDPLAEAEIYNSLDDFVKEKGAIYISHRLSSCYFCDRIAVFDQGYLVETGTHQELLSNSNSHYSALWNAQAQYYQS